MVYNLTYFAIFKKLQTFKVCNKQRGEDLEMGNLSNRIALVTGAGTGLGRGIALTFAKEGATVILNGRREEKLREVEKEIGDGKAIVITADLTVESEAKELSEKLKKETGGKIDILYNKAGMIVAL